MKFVKKFAIWLYVGVFLFLFGFAIWAGSSGAFLSNPTDTAKKLKKESPRPTTRGHHRRNRYFWPTGGVRGGK